MRVLVCGGRNYPNAARVAYVLGHFHMTRGIDVLIEGGARGADRHARFWAIRHGVHYATVPALWHANGNAAGPKRNAVMMLLAPEVVIAFPGGKGTADMIARARAAGAEVIEVSSDV